MRSFVSLQSLCANSLQYAVAGAVTTFALSSALALTACDGGGGKGKVALYGGETGTPVAKVGEATITAEMLEDRINRLNPYIRGRYKEPERLKEYLDTMVRTEILAQEALKLGLDKDAQVRDRIKNELAQKVITDEFDGKMRDKLVTDEDVKKYYDDNFDNYNKPEVVRVSHVFFAAPASDAGARAKKKAEAEKVLKELVAKDATDRRIFGEMAKNHSDDEKSKRLGGDLAYLSKEQMTKDFGAAFAEAAFGSKERGTLVSSLVETDNGYHLLKIRGRRDPIVKTFEQMKAPIRSRLYYEKRTKALEDWVKELGGKYGVEVNEAALANVKVKTDDAPAAGEGGPNPAPGAPGAPEGAAAPEGGAAPAAPAEDGHEGHGH